MPAQRRGGKGGRKRGQACWREETLISAVVPRHTFKCVCGGGGEGVILHVQTTAGKSSERSRSARDEGNEGDCLHCLLRAHKHKMKTKDWKQVST